MDGPEANCSFFQPGNVINKRFKVDHSFPIDRERLNYNFIPSLEHIARVNAALLVWNNPNITKNIETLFTSCETRKTINSISIRWRVIDANVVDEIERLNLPKSLTEPLICYAERIGQSIARWLLFCDKIIFKIHKMSPSKAIRYLNQLIWTPRGTIDQQKTARSIIKQDDLSSREKYLFACTYCLEPEVRTLARDVENINRYKRAQRDQPMAWYWTYCIQGKFHSLEVYNITYRSVTEAIFFTSSNLPDYGEYDTALKYIWNRLSEEQKEDSMLLILSACSPECCCFLLSQSSDLLEQKFLKRTTGQTILDFFIRNILWIDHITSIVLYSLEFISEESYCEMTKSFCHIIRYYRKNLNQYPVMYNKYVNIFYEIWRNSPSNFKNDIFERDDDLGAVLIYALSWENSADVIRAIFSDITPTQRRDVLKSSLGIKKCVHFITSNQQDSFHEFIALGFTEESDKDEFKTTLVAQKYKIFSSLKRNHGWTAVKEFIQWFFKSSPNDKLWDCVDTIVEKYFRTNKEIYEVKASILAYYLCDESFIQDYPDEESRNIKVTELVNWCLKLPDTCRRPSKKIDNLKEIIYFLISESNYTLADDILNVYLSNPQLQKDFKRNLFDERRAELILIFIRKNDKFASVQQYVNWSFSNTELNLKSYFLDLHFLIHLVDLNEYELLDKYTQWLKLPKIEITGWNNLLLHLGKICSVASRIIKNEVNELEQSSRLKKLIAWVQPSAGAIDEFEEEYEDDYPYELYKLLDQYAREDRSNFSEEIFHFEL